SFFPYCKALSGSVCASGEPRQAEFGNPLQDIGSLRFRLCILNLVVANPVMRDPAESIFVFKQERGVVNSLDSSDNEFVSRHHQTRAAQRIPKLDPESLRFRLSSDKAVLQLRVARGGACRPIARMLGQGC